jgi:hypothetical protein
MPAQQQQLSARLDERGRYRMPDVSRSTRNKNPLVQHPPNLPTYPDINGTMLAPAAILNWSELDG